MTEPPPSHTLNTNITFAELFRALKKLQRNKVAGLDGMKAKFILDAGELLHMPLHALFKRGDASEFDTYRGIIVDPILAKLFCYDP